MIPLTLLLACSSGPTAHRDSDQYSTQSVVDDTALMVDTSDSPTGTPPAFTGRTWYDDVGPLVFAHCVGCHTVGGSAPFELDNYEAAKIYGADMVQAVGDRSMPPGAIDNSGDCQTFSNSHWLNDDEIAVFGEWVAQGSHEGVESTPLARHPAPPFSPTHTIDIGADYSPDPSASDVFRCFLADPQTTEDLFVTGIDVNPGRPELVHHMILYSLSDQDAERQAEMLDAANPEPGYACTWEGVGVEATFLGGTTADTRPLIYPEGTGVRVPAGQKLIIQMHYHPDGVVATDRTSIDMAMQPTIDVEAYIATTGLRELFLRPQLPYVEETGVTDPPWNVPIKIWGISPHMHEIGVSLRATTVGPSGDLCLGYVPAWNADWQTLFLMDEPVELVADDLLEFTCGYDTSSRTTPTRYGVETHDEMCSNFVYFTVSDP